MIIYRVDEKKYKTVKIALDFNRLYTLTVHVQKKFFVGFCCTHSAFY